MSKKILIIDDDKNFCALVSVFLGKKGFTSATVNSGKEGIEASRQLAPDLILLDINMPKMDGFAVLEKLKNSEKTMAIPVIMLTGRGDDESKLKASSLYSQYYITKPFDLEELDAKIKQILKITI